MARKAEMWMLQHMAIFLERPVASQLPCVSSQSCPQCLSLTLTPILTMSSCDLDTHPHFVISDLDTHTHSVTSDFDTHLQHAMSSYDLDTHLHFVTSDLDTYPH